SAALQSSLQRQRALARGGEILLNRGVRNAPRVRTAQLPRAFVYAVVPAALPTLGLAYRTQRIFDRGRDTVRFSQASIYCVLHADAESAPVDGTMRASILCLHQAVLRVRFPVEIRGKLRQAAEALFAVAQHLLSLLAL